MELDNATKENIEKMIGENDVFLFMKGNPDFPMCGFSSVASAIPVSYTHLTLPTILLV